MGLNSDFGLENHPALVARLSCQTCGRNPSLGPVPMQVDRRESFQPEEVRRAFHGFSGIGQELLFTFIDLINFNSHPSQQVVLLSFWPPQI